MQTLLDIRQVAQILNISEDTIYSWTHKKKIRYIKVGRLVRFFPEDIKALLANNTYEKEYVG